jgi:hypothetical protein
VEKIFPIGEEKSSSKFYFSSLLSQDNGKISLFCPLLLFGTIFAATMVSKKKGKERFSSEGRK